jgi:hypothetical protein
MPAATQTFLLYTSHTDTTPALTLQVPTAQMGELEAAVRAGGWWADPANPNNQRHLVGIVRYVVSAP